MNTHFLTKEQHKFLSWLARNYEYFKSKGLDTDKWQPYQHNLHRIMVSCGYSDDDKKHIDMAIRFIKGVMGWVTYNPTWTYDKNAAEMDWLMNIKSDQFIKAGGNFRCNQTLTNLWQQK
jgi:hypothetical protein